MSRKMPREKIPSKTSFDQKEKNLISQRVQQEIDKTTQESQAHMLKQRQAKSNNPKKGFASMTQARVEEIAKKGGQARAEQLGHAGFVELGRKGGVARAEQLGHAGFVELGRKGGEARANQRSRNVGEDNNKTPASSSSNNHNDNSLSSLKSKNTSDQVEAKKDNLARYSINTQKIRQKQLEKQNKGDAAA